MPTSIIGLPAPCNCEDTLTLRGRRSATPVAGSRACAFPAAELATLSHGFTCRCARSRRTALQARLVPSEVGFLVRDTCTADKAIGARRARWHRLTSTLRRRNAWQNKSGNRQTYQKRRVPEQMSRHTLSPADPSLSRDGRTRAIDKNPEASVNGPER